MKTFADIAAWCDGASQAIATQQLVEEPIGHLFARHAPILRPDETDCVWTATPAEPGLIMLSLAPRSLLPLAVSSTGPVYSAEGDLEQLGVEPIAADLWALTPSLFVPELIHVFVVLYDVPVPAPWERRIVVAR